MVAHRELNELDPNVALDEDDRVDVEITGGACSAAQLDEERTPTAGS